MPFSWMDVFAFCALILAALVMSLAREEYRNQTSTKERQNKEMAPNKTDDSPAPAKTATAYRVDGVPLIKCPHCEYINSFPELDEVITFLCHECGEPVNVDKTVELPPTIH